MFGPEHICDARLILSTSLPPSGFSLELHHFPAIFDKSQVFSFNDVSLNGICPSFL